MSPYRRHDHRFIGRVFLGSCRSVDMDRFHALGLFQLGRDGFHAFTDDRSFFSRHIQIRFTENLRFLRNTADRGNCRIGCSRFFLRPCRYNLHIGHRFRLSCSRFTAGCGASLFRQIGRDDGGHIGQRGLFFFRIGYVFRPLAPAAVAFGFGLGCSDGMTSSFTAFSTLSQLLFLCCSFLFFLTLAGQFRFFFPSLIGCRFFLVHLFHGFQDFITRQDLRRIDAVGIGASPYGHRGFSIDDFSIVADRFTFRRDESRFFRVFPPLPQGSFSEPGARVLYLLRLPRSAVVWHV